MNPVHRILPKMGLTPWRGRVAGLGLAAAALVGGSAGRMLAQAPGLAGGGSVPLASHGGPMIQFTRTEHDFGRVKCGTTLKLDFAFTNSGDLPLEITSVQSSCGCSTAGDWTKSVQPGQTGSIPIQFNTDQLSGPVRKTVAVTCNAPGRARTVLDIFGTVWREIDVNPAVAFFTPKADALTVAPKLIRIVNNMEEPLTLAPPECADKAFTAALKTLREGREFELQVSVAPPFGPGVVQTPITISTSSKSLPVLTVKALVMVQLPVTAMPQQVSLGPAPLAAASKQVVTLRNLSGAEVSFSEPTVNEPGVTVAMRELQPGRIFEVSLEFPAGFVASSAGTTALDVKTSHPQCPSVRIPINHHPQGPQPSAVAGPAAAGTHEATPVGGRGMPATRSGPGSQAPKGAVGREIEASPAVIVLGPAPLAGGARLRVAIRNSGGEPVVFSEPVVNVPGVVAGIEELQPGRVCQVILDFPAGFEVKPGGTAELRVRTSHPGFPVVRVPILRGAQPVSPPLPNGR